MSYRAGRVPPSPPPAYDSGTRPALYDNGPDSNNPYDNGVPSENPYDNGAPSENSYDNPSDVENHYETPTNCYDNPKDAAEPPYDNTRDASRHYDNDAEHVTAYDNQANEALEHDYDNSDGAELQDTPSKVEHCVVAVGMKRAPLTIPPVAKTSPLPSSVTRWPASCEDIDGAFARPLVMGSKKSHVPV